MAINNYMARGNNPKLKKAHQEEEFTPEMLLEYKKCMEDPIYFCKNYIYIQHPTRGQQLFGLYDYQEEILNNYVNNRFNILLSARQTGKTETTAAYILWFAIFHKSKKILIVSNKSSNAMDIIERIQFAYEELPVWLKPGIDANNWNKHKCQFDNNSVIRAEATTETSGRSKSISLLYCDELAFVPEHIQEAFWSAILPTLATGGDCIISSTPNGDSDKFAELWRTAELGDSVGSEDEFGSDLKFKPKWIKWDMPPDRDENFKQAQIKLLGERQWLQEYECQFLGGGGTLLDNRIIIKREKEILGAGTSNVLFKIEDIPFFTQIKAGGTYLVGVDPATGTGSDFSVIELVEFPSMEQVMEFRSNTTRSPELYSTLKKILKFLTDNGCEILFSIENNGVGEGMLALYMVDEHFPENAELINESGKDRYGFTTTDAVKLKFANKLKTLIETGSLPIHSMRLLKELKNYARKGKAYEAKKGSTDDCVSAYLIIIRILEEMATYDDEAYQKLYALSVQDADNDWGEDDIEMVGDDEPDDNDGMAIII